MLAPPVAAVMVYGRGDLVHVLRLTHDGNLVFQVERCAVRFWMTCMVAPGG